MGEIKIKKFALITNSGEIIETFVYHTTAHHMKGHYESLCMEKLDIKRWDEQLKKYVKIVTSLHGVKRSSKFVNSRN